MLANREAEQETHRVSPFLRNLCSTCDDLLAYLTCLVSLFLGLLSAHKKSRLGLGQQLLRNSFSSTRTFSISRCDCSLNAPAAGTQHRLAHPILQQNSSSSCLTSCPHKNELPLASGFTGIFYYTEHPCWPFPFAMDRCSFQTSRQSSLFHVH